MCVFLLYLLAFDQLVYYFLCRSRCLSQNIQNQSIMCNDNVADWLLAVEYLDCNDLRKIDVKNIDPIVKELPIELVTDIPCDILRKIWCLFSEDKKSRMIQYLPHWNHCKSMSQPQERINCKDCRWFFLCEYLETCCRTH